MAKKEDKKQLFTQEQIDLFLPVLDHPLTEDEYLETLMIDNDGIDFGDVLDYDADEEELLMKLAESYYRPKAT